MVLDPTSTKKNKKKYKNDGVSPMDTAVRLEEKGAIGTFHFDKVERKEVILTNCKRRRYNTW